MSTTPKKSISGSAAPPATHLTWSDEINKRVRTGDWADQAISTTVKIVEAIEAGDWETAAQLVDYWMEEAKVVHVIYQVWGQGWGSFLASRGVGTDELEAEVDRLRRLLAFPDGGPFEPEPRWAELARSAGELGNRLRAYEISAEAAVADLDRLRESWRQLHDRGADYQSGMLSFVANRLGEAAVGDAYAHVLEPYLQERYKPFDLREQAYEDTLYRNLYLTFEAMRGHVGGPLRDGDMDLYEDDDKYVIAFDPCGSGTRGQRGDHVEGTGSRSDPPYNFGITTEEHDWAWNEKGVCYYCAHCCYTLELWPARQWGHPIRVVDSPLHPDETSGPEPKKCTWTVYKSLDAIPAEAYVRIGLTKPETD
ncbi:hypothetical protein [Candidatus Poriferisocius sp.]|uniref:hypothetical protein n=1 Tax=Candidatus Poriferisocius sp. TaxID=3101276 RepID=UPI003B5B3021